MPAQLPGWARRRVALWQAAALPACLARAGTAGRLHSQHPRCGLHSCCAAEPSCHNPRSPRNPPTHTLTQPASSHPALPSLQDNWGGEWEQLTGDNAVQFLKQARLEADKAEKAAAAQASKKAKKGGGAAAPSSGPKAPPRQKAAAGKKVGERGLPQAAWQGFRV